MADDSHFMRKSVRLFQRWISKNEIFQFVSLTNPLGASYSGITLQLFLWNQTYGVQRGTTDELLMTSYFVNFLYFVKYARKNGRKLFNHEPVHVRQTGDFLLLSRGRISVPFPMEVTFFSNTMSDFPNFETTTTY